MLKSQSYTINNLSKILTLAFCVIITTLSAWYLYSDLKYYKYNSSLFSNWQIPLFLMFCVAFLFLYLWFLITKKYFIFAFMSIFISLVVLFIPYEKYGDFEKLRLISFCEGDGRLCKEGVYPYLTKQWCTNNGYLFDDNTKFCKMRINTQLDKDIQ